MFYKDATCGPSFYAQVPQKHKSRTFPPTPLLPGSPSFPPQEDIIAGSAGPIVGIRSKGIRTFSPGRFCGRQNGTCRTCLMECFGLVGYWFIGGVHMWNQHIFRILTISSQVGMWVANRPGTGICTLGM